MDIISRRSGQRPKDAKARSLVERNRGTIEKLADQISNVAYSASRRAAAEHAPKASGLIVSDLGAKRAGADPKPYLRVSPNAHVVVVDDETSRQMHLLGEIGRMDARPVFLLATCANGFFPDLDADLALRLAPLDRAPMGGARTDAALASEFPAPVGYA